MCQFKKSHLFFFFPILRTPLFWMSSECGESQFPSMLPTIWVFRCLRKRESSRQPSLVSQRLKHLPAIWENWVWSDPGVWKIPWEGNDNPLQYSCLENSMDGGTWWVRSPWDRKESDMTEWLHFHFQGRENHLDKCQYLGLLIIFISKKGFR